SGDPDKCAGSADCLRADANRTGPAVQQGYGIDAAMVRARRLQRRHRWPGTRVRPRAHEAPRLGTPPRATKWALKREAAPGRSQIRDAETDDSGPDHNRGA